MHVILYIADTLWYTVYQKDEICDFHMCFGQFCYTKLQSYEKACSILLILPGSMKETAAWTGGIIKQNYVWKLYSVETRENICTGNVQVGGVFNITAKGTHYSKNNINLWLLTHISKLDNRNHTSSLVLSNEIHESLPSCIEVFTRSGSGNIEIPWSWYCVIKMLINRICC